jgi:hypothetical protein
MLAFSERSLELLKKIKPDEARNFETASNHLTMGEASLSKGLVLIA